MPVAHVKIPKKVIDLNKPFTKAEIRVVIASMLLRINLPIFRANQLRLNIRHFGVIKTHGNKKKVNKLKYVRDYNKKYWQRTKLKKLMSEK